MKRFRTPMSAAITPTTPMTAATLPVLRVLALRASNAHIADLPQAIGAKEAFQARRWREG